MAGESKPKVRKTDTIYWVDPKSLKPYENNPRLNEEAVEYVMNSIKAAAPAGGPLEEGFKDPIEVNQDMVIICGHTRQKAALRLGLKKVKIIILQFDSVEAERMYRLTNNKVGEQAGWDFEKLTLELDDLQDLFNVEEFGFVLDEDDDQGYEEPDEPGEPQEGEVTRRERTEYNIIMSFPTDMARDEAYERLVDEGYVVKKV